VSQIGGNLSLKLGVGVVPDFDSRFRGGIEATGCGSLTSSWRGYLEVQTVKELDVQRFCILRWCLLYNL